MDHLPGADAAGQRLKQTALREFGPPPPPDRAAARETADPAEPPVQCYRLELARRDVPVPPLLRYALQLIGLRPMGPGEKAAWSVAFTYQGQLCELAHQKFGVRLYLWTTAPEAEGRKTLSQIAKKLRASTRTVEGVILAAAPGLLARGDATVVNQHAALDRAYLYFRERASTPEYIPDVKTIHQIREGVPTAYSFNRGDYQMTMNAFHDLVAAITAYLSRLEHDLILALAFTGFDPAVDDLTALIGSRWGEKFERVLGNATVAAKYRQRLTDVVERWRNPYSHGGFEKGHTATIYLHTPNVGALPVGLSSVRHSPLFSLLPADESDVAGVFRLLDEIDRWLEAELPHAMSWIRSGLSVRFDQEFRESAQAAVDSG